MKTYFAVTGILKHKGKFLILKKSPDDWNYPGKWSFCSGFIKEFESAEDTVLREIKEETGLDAKITRRGRILEIADKKKQKRWIVSFFLCSSNSQTVNLDSENSDFRWVDYKDIKKYETVPGMGKDLKVLGLI